LRGTGLALLEVGAAGVRVRASRTLRLARTLPLAVFLGAIFRAVDEALAETGVRHVAVEQTIYVQNFQTAQILGAARGAVLAAAAMRGLEVFEYPPLRVKQAVVGYGRAGKDQVARTVAQHLGLAKALPSDEADAVAVALCHALTWHEPPAG
jgi:crossover junction endodeoxyribonuclease RuvC